MDHRSTIRQFIRENFFVPEGSKTLEDSTSFLESGIVDSTGVLEIVQFVEETFGIAVADEELLPENLDSIENLSAFVARKLAEQSGQAKCAP